MHRVASSSVGFSTHECADCQIWSMNDYFRENFLRRKSYEKVNILRERNAFGKQQFNGILCSFKKSALIENWTESCRIINTWKETVKARVSKTVRISNRTNYNHIGSFVLNLFTAFSVKFVYKSYYHPFKLLPFTFPSLKKNISFVLFLTLFHYSQTFIINSFCFHLHSKYSSPQTKTKVLRKFSLSQRKLFVFWSRN